VLVVACLNGRRSRTESRLVPLTPAELAAEGCQAVASGAEALHVHPRDGQGDETLDGAWVGAAMAAVRESCPGIPVGVTTGGWIAADAARRAEAVRPWRVRPDFASVNLGEEGSVDLCRQLLGAGIRVEAGVWSPADAEALVAAHMADAWMRVLLEPMEDTVQGALESVAGIEAVLDEAGVTVPRLLHGVDRTAWPMLDLAIRRGYQVRMGLEDVLRLPDWRSAGNADLVAEARARVRRGGQ
jgi:uncharacterized protein (DUF849 family)